MSQPANTLLRYRADGRTVLLVLATLTLLVGQWSGLVRHPLVFVASSLLCFTSCVVNHNHQHCPVFVPPLGNRIFGVLIALATGQPAKAIVPMHMGNHHAYNNEREDFVRASLVQHRWNLLNLITFPFVAVAGYARAKSRDLTRWRKQNPHAFRQLVLERAVLYPALVAAIVMRPFDTLMYLGLPYVLGQWAILAINLVQHDGCDPNSRYNHSRNHLGRLLNWWLFNNGYHTAHHLRPGLHWSRLPAYHSQIATEIHPRLCLRSLTLNLIALYIWPAQRPRVEEVKS